MKTPTFLGLELKSDDQMLAEEEIREEHEVEIV